MGRKESNQTNKFPGIKNPRLKPKNNQKHKEHGASDRELIGLAIEGTNTDQGPRL